MMRGSDYWSAVDHFVALIRDVVLRPESASRERMGILAAIDPDVLFDVVTDVGAAACVQLAETYDGDAGGYRLVSEILHPDDGFAARPDAAGMTPEVTQGICLILRRVMDPDPGREQKIEYTTRFPRSSEDILNAALPVVAQLVNRCVSPDGATAFSPLAGHAKSAIVIEYIYYQLARMVGGGRDA